MKTLFGLFFILVFFISACHTNNLSVNEPKIEKEPPVLILPTNSQKNIFELSTYEKDKSLTVVLPDGWKRVNLNSKEGEGTTTTYSNGLSGGDEKFFIVFESLLNEESKTFTLEKLFQSFKDFCHSIIGNVDFSPTKIINDKRTGLVYHAALGLETTQPSLFILATTKFSENVSFSFICFETDSKFKICGKIFESLTKN